MVWQFYGSVMVWQCYGMAVYLQRGKQTRQENEKTLVLTLPDCLIPNTQVWDSPPGGTLGGWGTTLNTFQLQPGKKLVQ